ncbi:RNA pyrophosphohydrolase [Brevundimonas sp. Leaf363]|uniref:RNA pyrophosphohydrolase n=1 Tax=Brevundimonas sp. Leaf363 TaxID=1736353 RepID=UPI0006F8DB84|nr:RNA pyrophosphohydrolase [Brevundimonas sp. Leaf363]KQS55212.1 RNA pyrophosphohydrolase [Brevundimonas sp. Leaf363]
MTDTDLPRHRPNVGVVLFHPDGRVWYGRRAGSASDYCWQFPQGGVDEGEDLETAARRELQEETGVTSIELLARTDGWIAYDFPKDYGGSKQARGYLGQKQVWFAYRFTGEESEIDLEAHEVEFDAWRWGRLDEACDLIVPFKRPAYEQVVAAFGVFAA